MSQVKKLQTGGSITIDGIKYNATPEFINALTTHIGNVAGSDAQTLAGLTNALQNGENLTYNSASNTITGMNGLWGGISDRQNENRRANTSGWRKWWDAQFDTDAHRFRNALTAIGSFHWQPNDKKEDETSNLKDIYGDKTWYKYDVDKDGNKTWLDNAGENIAIAQRLADVTSYLKDPEAGKKAYRLGSWYTPDRVAALQGLYGKYTPETWQASLDAIAERAKSNTLSAEDRAFLANFNIVEPDEATATTSGNGLSAADRTKWNNAGHGGLADLLGGRAHINDDGSISLNEGESWGWNLGDLEGKNIWFNDDFFNSRYGADGSFDPYRNYTLYNNRLYALDNPTLARILNADGGFNAMMKSGNWTGADNQILTRFTDLARENPAYLNPYQYSTFLSANPNYRFSDLTGLATTNGMTDDQQLIQYVNLGDDSLEGPYRRYNYKYALLNNRGGLERELTPEEVIQLENGQARETGLNTYKRTVGQNNGAYNNRYYEDILDKNGEATGFRFYRSINNPNEDVILHMPEIYASGTENQDIVLPKEVAQVLMNNPNWLDNVVGNAQNKKNFMKILSSLVQSRLGQFDTLWYRNETAQLKKMGFSQSEIDQFLKAFNESRKGSRDQRRDNMLVTATTLQKNGGILKDQKGGIAGGAKTATGVTEKRVSTTNTNPKNAAGVSEIEGKNWTDADTADLGALLADIGSLGLAFVPGANIGSAATGAVGSTARLYADLNRGTKGAGWNYLLNLGMDAATLLPVLGGGAKGLKIVKGVKAALPTIIKAASVYGLGAGVVDTAKKIASGQKFTVRDVDMLVNTLTAGVGLGKSGGFGKGTKTTKTKAYSENFKIGDKDVTLDDATIKRVLSASDQPKALREAIKAKVPNAADKDIAAAAESLLKEKKTIWQRVRGKDGDIVVNAKKKTIESTTTQQANGNKWHDWWYGVGDKQAAYNAQLRGEPTLRQEIVLPSGNRSELMLLEPNLPAVVKQVGSPRQGIALPQWINPFTSANYQLNQDQQPAGAVMQPLFKKGGKIEKGATGLQLNGPILNPNLSTGFKFKTDPLYTVPTGSTTTFTPAKPTALSPEFQNFRVTNPMTGKAVQTATKSTGSDAGGDSLEKQNPYSQGTFSEQKWIPDLNVPMNWARSLYAMKQSDNQLENFLNRPRLQHKGLLRDAPRMILTGAGNAYRNQANQIIDKQTTSNGLDAGLLSQMNAQQRRQLNLQGDLQDSQEFGQYRREMDNFINEYGLQRYNIADQNDQLRWQHGIEDVQAKNANIAEKSKFFDQAAYATQDWYNRNWQTRGAIESQRAYTNELAALDKWYKEQMVAHNNTYKDDPNSEAAAQHLASINSQLALRKNNLGNSGLIGQLSPMFRQWWGYKYKSGGKVSSGKRSAVTYSKDPYPELLLQNSKDSAQAVKQLNDAIIKLLLQTKPINVH